jgi:D-alanyl-D-alanine carboxypeptidase
MVARTSRAMVAVAALAMAPTALAGPALLFDVSDGAVLYAEDLDNQWHPASLTKMMTAYVTFVAIKEGTLTLETKIGCSILANSQGPTKVGLPVGATITVETALQALIMKSANDVAVMLAEAVSGSHEAFVDYMNGMAGRLGMTRTKFANANGLPDAQQVTTARDLAKLAAAVVRDFPEYAPMWSMLAMHVGKLQLHTHNGLLTNYAGADGMKTGFICDSGFNVVASATRGDRKLIAVVLGEATGADRTLRAANLLEHGFRTQGWKTLFAPQTLDSMPMDENAKTAVTKAARVISVVCGTGGRAVARVKKGKVVAGETGTKNQIARSSAKRIARTKNASSSWPW